MRDDKLRYGEVDQLKDVLEVIFLKIEQFFWILSGAMVVQWLAYE